MYNIQIVAWLKLTALIQVFSVQEQLVKHKDVKRCAVW